MNLSRWLGVVAMASGMLLAAEPGSSYSQLDEDELKLRFRFPERYLDRPGEPAPRDMALYEFMRRKLLGRGTTRTEVERLLGRHDSPLASTKSPEWYYGMMGGTLYLTFANEMVSNMVVHHDGENARDEPLLESADGTPTAGKPAAAAPSRDAQVVVPQLRTLAAGQPTLAALKRLLGEPDADRGSGIHIPEWKLADGTVVRAGSIDGSAVLYLDCGAERLFPAAGQP